MDEQALKIFLSLEENSVPVIIIFPKTVFLSFKSSSRQGVFISLISVIFPLYEYSNLVGFVKKI